MTRAHAIMTMATLAGVLTADLIAPAPERPASPTSAA